MTKILILGGDSDYNLGDAAILAALCGALAADGHQITVTSSRLPPLLPSGATAVIPRGFAGSRALLQAAYAADLVVIGGGGLLQDDDSRVKMPYWASRVALLRTANRNLIGHSIGAGPLKHPESQIAARFTCSALASITVRDAFAQAALRACTRRPIEIVPDPAFMLAPASPATADRFLSSIGIPPGRPILGISLRNWFHVRGGFIPARIRAALGLSDDRGQATLARLLHQLAATFTPLARQLDASILMLPTYNAPYENDVEICKQFAQLVSGCEVRIATLDDPALYKAVTGRLRALISSRMHPLILAAGMGTPVIGLAYNGKFAGMFDLLGTPRRMLWLDEVVDSPPARLRALIESAIHADDQLQQRASRLADRVRQKTVALIVDRTPFARVA